MLVSVKIVHRHKYKKFIMYNIKKIKKLIRFSDIEIKKAKFHYSKYPININVGNVNKMITTNRKFCKKGYKYFIGHKGDEKVKPLCIMLPKMTRCTINVW